MAIYPSPTVRQPWHTLHLVWPSSWNETVLSVTDTEYRELFKKCLEPAIRNPKRYRLGMFLLVLAATFAYVLFLLGFLFITVFVFLVVALFVALTRDVTLVLKMRKDLETTAVPLLCMIRGLWVTESRLKGVAVKVSDHPELQRELKEISTALNTKMPNRVLLTPEANASAAAVRRFWILAGRRRCLVLGLALLDSVSRDEARAIIAHELAHFHGNHGAQRRLIAFVATIWQQCVEKLSEVRGTSGAVGKAFSWLGPRFSARLRALGQAQEFEADRLAAQVCTPLLMGHALVRLKLSDPLWSELFEAALNQKVGEMPGPPVDLYECFPCLAPTSESEEVTRARLESELAERESFGTHPTLASRLASLGLSTKPADYMGPMTNPPQPSAAQELFASGLPALRRQVGEFWSASIAPAWHERHRMIAQEFDEIAEIRAKRATDRSIDEKWELLMAEANGATLESREAEIREFLAEAPDHETAILSLAAITAERDDPEFLDVMRLLDPSHSFAALHYMGQLAAEFADRNPALVGDEECRHWLKETGLAMQDRTSRLMAVDIGAVPVRAHGLLSKVIRRVVRVLTDFPIGEAWLMEVGTDRSNRNNKVFLLIYRKANWSFDIGITPLQQRVVSALASSAFGKYRFMVLESSFGARDLIKAAEAIPGNKILPAEK